MCSARWQRRSKASICDLVNLRCSALGWEGRQGRTDGSWIRRAEKGAGYGIRDIRGGSSLLCPLRRAVLPPSPRHPRSEIRDSRHGPRWRRISDRIRTDAAPRRVASRRAASCRAASSRAEEINSVLCWRRHYARTDIQTVTSGTLWNRRAVPGQTALSTSCPARCIELKVTKPTTSPAADYQPTYLSEVC